MNKKFFTLLVALLATISFGAFAQNSTPSPVDKNFSTTKHYLLKADGGGFLAMIPTENGLKLVTVPAVTGYQALQQASWTVTVSKGSGAAAPTFVLKNVASGEILSLASANAKDAVNKYTTNTPEVNVIGGDMTSWLSTRTLTTVGTTQFYWVVDGKDTANGLTVTAVVDADVNTVGVLGVMPYNIKTGEGATTTPEAAFTKFDWYEASGSIALKANDLNTMFQTTGKPVVGGQLEATEKSFFNLTIDPENNIESPFTQTLQARAVVQQELKPGTGGNVGGTNVDAVWTAAAYASLYPKGSDFKKDGTIDIKLENKSVNDNTDEWYALYSQDADAYLVVDTGYFDGTNQQNNGLIKIATDGLYNAKNTTRYRHPQSYLFKFVYDAATNSIDVVTRKYVNEVDKADRVKATTTNSTFYTTYADAPVLQGSTWPSGTYESVKAAGQPAKDVQDGTNAGTWAGDDFTPGDDVHLTYAKLVDRIVYTFGDTPNAVIKLGVSKEYVPHYISTGVYTLKVVDSEDATRIGKYLKMTLNGKFEYIEQAKRQNFKEMPSAQWVITTTGSSTSPNSTFINREFEDNLRTYVDGVTTPYKVTGESKQFFFWTGDTYEYEAVDGTDPYMGYKYVENPEHDLNRYEFRYLHELAMDKPINTKNSVDSAVWVAANDAAATFSLVLIADDTYGYYIDKNTKVVQLKRAAYRIRVHQAQNFEVTNRYLAYDKDNKKYYLTSEDNASAFFLKENNEVEVTETRADATKPYYILLEANIAYNVMKGKIMKDGSEYSGFGSAPTNVVVDNEIERKSVKITADDDAWEGYFYATEQTTRNPETGLDTEAWLPKLIENEDDFEQFLKDNNLSLEEYLSKMGKDIYGFYPEGVGEPYYIYWMAASNERYALSKVAVDNNTLNLVNGIIADDKNNEVNNSAFSVAPSETKLYRTLGDEEDEEKDINIVKFFRLNSAEYGKEYLYEDANSNYSKPVNGEDNADRVSQINFLGVEGKGMDKKSAMKVRYTSGDVMPQYLISLGEEVVPGTDPILCPECNGQDPNCTHNVAGTEGYITGRFLINLIDSINSYDEAAMKEKFQWEKQYTRLAFVDGTMNLEEDRLNIGGTAFDLTVNKHTPVLFQFRLLADDSNDFLIESESWDDDKTFDGGIAPNETNGGWVKIQNGVPVIVNNKVSNESYAQAEIFNLEVTDENPTSNAGIEAGKVEVIAGQGTVTIKGAAGQQVVVANILGQVIANQVLTSDEATIAAPAGVVVVSVNGAATKALVK